MAIQSLDLGTSADDGTGDSLRVGGDKINDNFSELYTLLGNGSILTTGLSVSGATITLSEAVGTFTTITPNSADSASLGTAALGWSDLYLYDSSVIYFGIDSDITLTHVPDVGLRLKSAATADDKPIVLTLQTGETDIAASDVLGKIEFQAPDEGTGTDAILVAASIAAISEGNFSSSSNATKLSFATGASEAASEKMSLSSAGVLTTSSNIVSGGNIIIPNDGNIGSVGDTDAIAISSAGVVTFADDLVIKTGGTIGGANDTDLLTLTSAVLTVAGEVVGTGFTGTLDGILGSGAAAAATTTTLNTSGVVNLNLTTESSSSTSGALIIDGGVGVAKKLFVGTDFDVSGNSVIDGTALVTGVATFGDDVVSDTDSTDDLGTTGVRWANLFVDAITATDQITATGFTGTLDGILGSGAAAAASVTTLDTSGVVNLNLTTDSTSSTSGALIVDGGVGVAKKLFVGTALDVSTTLTVDGASTLTGAVLKGATATEHGAGAVATSFAPVTRRSTSNGVITTKIHFDLTGLGGKGGAANDAIGLPAGGNAFIGRNVVGTNGVIYRAELACIELAAAASGSATVDIDVATNASGTIAYDGAGGTAKLFNTGAMVAGQELSNVTPAITANDFFYLVEGDTAATDGVYNGGQFVLTLYGHAVA